LAGMYAALQVAVFVVWIINKHVQILLKVYLHY
jgi:hypothetical protein